MHTNIHKQQHLLAWIFTPESFTPIPFETETESTARELLSTPKPTLTLKIVYFLSKYFALFPYNFNGEKFILNKLFLHFSIVKLLILCGSWMFMTQQLHTYFVQEGNVVSAVEPILLTALNMTLMTLSLLRGSNLLSVIEAMRHLENELSPKSPAPGMWACIFPIGLTLLASLMDIVTSLNDSTLSDTIMYIPYYWAVLGACVVETQFNAACLSLRYWFWILNQRLTNIRRRALGASLRLEALRLCHGRLYSAAYDLEEAFGPQLLLDCATCFLGTVLNAYFGVNGFYDGGSGSTASEIMQNTQWLWAFLYLTRISTLCFTCTRLTIEAQKTNRIVNHLSDFRLSLDMKEEINNFSMQVSTSKLEFTAWGIITLDFSLLFAIVSSTTTYLLILIQYRPK